jgi:hypothetical protein
MRLKREPNTSAPPAVYYDPRSSGPPTRRSGLGFDFTRYLPAEKIIPGVPNPVTYGAGAFLLTGGALYLLAGSSGGGGSADLPERA